MCIRDSTSIDEETRLEAFRTVQHVMGDRALTVPLYTAMNGIAANANLQGVKADQMGNYWVYNWSWAE